MGFMSRLPARPTNNACCESLHRHSSADTGKIRATTTGVQRDGSPDWVVSARLGTSSGMRRVFVLSCIMCTLVATATCGFALEPPRTLGQERDDEHRVAAEWEPVTGVLIGWPLRLPKALLTELAKDVDLFVTVKDRYGRQKARRAFAEWGIESRRCHFVMTTQGDGYYLTRDWGPFAVFDAHGKMTLVDGRYLDYPHVSADDVEQVTSLSEVYELDYHYDDHAPAAVAKALGLPRKELPIVLTGGNLFFDGLGTGFATQILIDENLGMGVSREQFLERIKLELGVSKFHVLPNFEGGDGGIQHIDCVLKLLDEERILVKRPPADHPDLPHINAVVRHLAKLTNPYGHPYTLLRIDTPRYDNDELANYTNSIIVNRKIYVPLFDIPGDKQALRTWRAVMPGYNVVGFVLDKEEIDLRYTDAIHCRVRGIWDPNMLLLTHKRIESRVPNEFGFFVGATIRDYSGQGLIEDRLRLAWRTMGSPQWTEVRLKPSATENAFGATMEGAQPGQTIEDYLSASSRSGRMASLPRTAPKTYYSFTVAATKPAEPSHGEPAEGE